MPNRSEESAVPDDHSFALCLTHDVDRPYKTFQAPYYALAQRNLDHLFDLLPGANPYWQFNRVAEMEEELGVRSAFYFLDEQRLWERPAREWLSPSAWSRYLGRYDIESTDIAAVIKRLSDGGWEIGLHGSYHSYDDPGRLAAQKSRVEAVLDRPVTGGRQHHLNLDVPNTWRHHVDVGLQYDTSLGSSETYGFDHGYRIHRPFDNEFVVFPLTLMELALPDPRTDRAWSVCEELLEEARENEAVMTVLWHPRYFSEPDFPGFGSLYQRLVERALEMDAWVGPPGDLYDQLDHPRGGE